ncbi:hypothetical protein I41_44810 [Lacipirellula limnantheis]|uniref:Uncharacterized protein n=1 Tax=Lacipirellula limnantheis TaxID=2528024 RepID=A0A517U3S2_9BACT|nr:hypothetical protein I41_44810 [Lacipirellula limnantheis]
MGKAEWGMGNGGNSATAARAMGRGETTNLPLEPQGRAGAPLYIGEKGGDRRRVAIAWGRPDRVAVRLVGERLGDGYAHANFSPVMRSQASMYLARVFSTMSRGRSGGGLFLSQPLAESQSRTNCLSNEGWAHPSL